MPDCPIRFRRPVSRKRRKVSRRKLREWAENGWLNMVGGCCGTTPDHIRAIAADRAGLPAAKRAGGTSARATVETLMRALRITALRSRAAQHHAGIGFVIVGERTNITGSPKFSKLILGGDFDGALAVARQQVNGGANILDVNMDEGMIDSEAAMTRFLNLIGSEPEIARIPIMIDSSKWSVIEAGLKCVQGKASSIRSA